MNEKDYENHKAYSILIAIGRAVLVAFGSIFCIALMVVGIVHSCTSIFEENPMKEPLLAQS